MKIFEKRIILQLLKNIEDFQERFNGTRKFKQF